MGRHKKIKRDWGLYPIRKVQGRRFTCGICRMWLHPGDLYFDGGVGMKVHLSCGRANTEEDPRRG